MSPYQLPGAFLENLLQEDSPWGDATTFALGIGQQTGQLVFRPRQEMVLCGSEEARRMGELRGQAAVGLMQESGSQLAADEEIPGLSGDVASSRQPTKIAAAGGINAVNAEAYARAGARILVTSAPYSAPPRDVAVTLEPFS